MLNFRVGGRHGGGWVHSRFLLFGIGWGGGWGTGVMSLPFGVGLARTWLRVIGLDFSN